LYFYIGETIYLYLYKYGATTFSIMTFGITTMSIMGLIVTLSINNTGHLQLMSLC